MPSGQQRGEENIGTFRCWSAGKTDRDFAGMTVHGQLSRTLVARECGFARSVLLQNPQVRMALFELEAELRRRGVLPAPVDSAHIDSRPTGQHIQNQAAVIPERIRRLETENIALRAEVTQLRAALKRFAIIESVVAETGRLPR